MGEMMEEVDWEMESWGEKEMGRKWGVMSIGLALSCGGGQMQEKKEITVLEH